METDILVKGFVVGLLMCAPVGPIGMLCLKRILTHGRRAGAASVLGASTADALYCSLAGLGVGFLARIIEQEHVWIELCGGIILVVLGLKIALSAPREASPKREGPRLFDAFSSAFLMMMANPTPIVVFSAALAALGIKGWRADFFSTASLVVGVFVGSAIWSLVLVAGASFFNLRRNPDNIRFVNRVSGAIISVFGLVLVAATVMGITLQ